MSPLDTVLEKLDFKSSGSGFIARWPAHVDQNPSLSIADGEVNTRMRMRTHTNASKMDTPRRSHNRGGLRRAANNESEED
jgi:hypothetical protein